MTTKPGKNILMVAYSEYLSDARIRRAAETLALRGHHLVLISLKDGMHPASAIVNDVVVQRVPFARYRGGSAFLYMCSYFMFVAYVFFLVAWKSLKQRPDAVYVHTMPDFVVLVSLIPRLLGSRIIIDFHDMMPELYMDKFRISENHVITRFLKLQERVCASLAHAVICVHEPHKSVLIARDVRKEKISVVLNVPDPSLFGFEMKRWMPVEQLHVVYHGTIVKRLGLDIAVNAFADVVPVIPNSKFFIFGRGDYLDHLEALVETKHLQSSVQLSRDFFSVEQVPRMLAHAAMGLIANRRTPATEFMLPVKLMEYVYLGIPVIAPRLKTISYYFPDNSLMYYEPENCKALAGAIVSLWHDEDRRHRMTERAQEILKGFEWATVQQNLLIAIDLVNAKEKHNVGS